MKGRIPGRSLLLAAAVAWMVSGVVAAKEPDAVRKYESEGRSSFDYGIGIRTDIVRNKRLPIEENEPMETHVVILGTSDIHGNICCWSYEENRETDYGMARLYTCIQETRNGNPVTFLIDGGDEIQGNVLTDEIACRHPEEPHPVIAAMNDMGYDAMTIGNHEFDWGVDDLLQMLDTARFPVLGQNVSGEDGKLLTGEGWTILERGGIRLAVIGVVTPDVPRLEGDREGVSGLSFEDASKAVKKAITEIGDRADILMVSAHMGMAGEYEDAKGGDSAQRILDENPEIDVLQVGHYHTTVHARQGQTVIGGVRNAGREIVRFDLTLDEEKNVTDSGVSIISMEDYQPDQGLCKLPEVRKAHEAALAQALSAKEKDTEEEPSTVVGFATARFQPENEISGIPQGRLEDTPLVDLILKVQLMNSGADVSASPMFRDTCDLPEGDISDRDIFRIYEYNNTLCRLRVTGKELKDYMEWSAAYYNQWTRGDINISFDPDIPGSYYDMFEGIVYDINLSKPKGERIENVMFRGKPLRDDQTLTLAVTNYRYSSTLKGENLVAGEKEWESSISIRDMIVKYFEKMSPVKPETDNSWRITGIDLQEDDPRREELIRAINDGRLEVPYYKSYNLKDYEALMDLVSG